MASPPKMKSSTFKPAEHTDTYEEDRDRQTMFDGLHATMKEKTVLQRLIVIAQLPRDVDRTKLGAHYEKLNLQLSKQHMWDIMTGLLLIYPSFLLHVIESSRDILVSVLKDLRDLQHQKDSILVEASKVVFMVHNPQSRLFQQWSNKVLETDQVAGSTQTKGVHEEEETTDTLVCTLLSALQNLSNKPEMSKKAPSGSVLDETLEVIIPQKILQLLKRDELLSPQQYLQMYNSHLNISMDFGQVIRSSCLSTV